MPEYRIRAVVFKEGEHWIAKCLEYSYSIQVRRLEDVPRELRRCLAWQILLSLEMGIEPFNGFKPSSRKYWEMYERAAPLEEASEAFGFGPDIEVRLAA
jgi:hypothetical protein